MRLTLFVRNGGETFQNEWKEMAHIINVQLLKIPTICQVQTLEVWFETGGIRLISGYLIFIPMTVWVKQENNTIRSASRFDLSMFLPCDIEGLCLFGRLMQ
jgi:hypothetical protein